MGLFNSQRKSALSTETTRGIKARIDAVFAENRRLRQRIAILEEETRTLRLAFNRIEKANSNERIKQTLPQPAVPPKDNGNHPVTDWFGIKEGVQNE